MALLRLHWIVIKLSQTGTNVLVLDAAKRSVLREWCSALNTIPDRQEEPMYAELARPITKWLDAVP